MVVTFDDKEQLEYISSFVNMVSGIYKQSAISTISTLACKLTGLHTAAKVNTDCELDIELSEDTHDNDQLYCLYNMCHVLNSIGADEVNAGIDMYNKLKKHYTKSDVPKFLEMLNDYDIPAEYCIELFSHWSSGEGTATLAEDCMHIQAEYDIVMTPVWEWVYRVSPNQDTDWREEVNKYKEAVNVR